MSAQTKLNLPGQSTSLIGRETELAEIRSLLADPYCRLLTLVGPGGIGKSRLAVEVAARMDGFVDGVYFVPLQPIASADLLVPAIATATGLPLAGKEPLLTQLLYNLRRKQMLLLLDNFEHLLPAAGLLVEVMRDAPTVKLLVTSREVVGIRQEWLYLIQGLSIPATAAAIDPADYGAIHLFSTRARQVRRDFRWESEREAVISICRQVEGNPLAVELAASWLSTLNSAAIATQLRQGMDILTSSLRDLPERHRSMRVVFDHSWLLLGEGERAVFARLTVFRGGFTLAAAQAVAGATLGDLSALVAKSLIRRDADGRYQIHELLRQYGAEKLAVSPFVEAAHEAYSAYFMAFLAERRFAFDGHGQIQAVQDIANELENIRSAWHWAVHHLQAEAILPALRSLFFFYQHRSRYLEGAETLADTVRHLESGDLQRGRGVALAECLTYFGWLCIRLSRLAEANAALARARHLYDTLGIHPPQYRAGDPITALLILALVQGDYEQALTLSEQARRQAEQHNQPAALAFAYYGLANALLAQGKYAQAQTFAEQGLALNSTIGNRWLLSYSHDILGLIAYVQEKLHSAKHHFEASYAIREEFEDPGGMALNLRSLGDVAIRRKEWSEAHVLYTSSLALYRELGDQGGMAGTQRGLGIAAYHLGDLNGARSHFRQALETAVATDTIRLVLSVLAAAGEFLAEQPGMGHRQTFPPTFAAIGESLGLRILHFVAQHPSADQTTRNEAAGYLQRKSASLNGTADESLEMLTAALQAELTTAPERALPPAQVHSFAPVEPLTAREAEVLKQLAAGRTNAEIADELIIAVGTVKAYTSTIYRKLDVANRAQAVARAHELGLQD